MSFDFTGKTAVVTGAAGGIGRAVCLSLARAGARVVAVDLSAQAGEQTAASVRDAGGEAIFVAGDVARPDDHAAYVAAATQAWGGIDIFMNNAGWQGDIKPVIDYPVEVFDKVMAINVRGVFLGLQNVLPVMIAQGSGAVVNTASLGSYIGTRNLAPYSASKHAVMGLTKSAALEVARKGVRINAICPGPVDTEMLRDIEAGQSPQDAEALRAKRAASIPDGRYAEAEEVADLMLYLVSDHARHITGQGIHVNGGAYAI
ncbi:SDR family NAD(P)-dependent oxidoreductase [Sulfitobacter sabulilitoris]|uniref:SDR family oxidoreductase n=1 Tax=Sulfitobacter sabulilitoris TaxID=2562655 RepID=A0A5S3PD35_9RHOB|nr:SDR family NAD(P)-dependent oxidoreductase [Sulfitobacter sabulilitoris]TMM51736.1 SDR family oxidoreductase [Sulfitobacter sabulilitoris]